MAVRRSDGIPPDDGGRLMQSFSLFSLCLLIWSSIRVEACVVSPEFELLKEAFARGSYPDSAVAKLASL